MKENSVYKGDLKFARVSFSDINNLNNKIFIDLGTKDGIKIHAVSCKALKTISLESLLEAHWQ